MGAAGEQFEITDKAAPSDLDVIQEGLVQYSVEQGLIHEPLYILARDDKGAVRGGLTGWIGSGCLYIRWLWVRPEERRNGLGRVLMELAEKKAQEKACERISVDTMSYQAPGFYTKIGYKPTATLRNFIEGHDRIFFEKSLKEGKL